MLNLLDLIGRETYLFQKDILNLVYLCKYYGLDEVAEYWHQVVKINDYQKNRFTQKIIDHFGGDLTGKKIAVLGWSFKADTNDSRESAAIHVTEKLYKAGANLEIYDPMVTKDFILRDISLYWNCSSEIVQDRIRILNKTSSFKESNAIAILTEWTDFKKINFYKSKVFDGRNVLRESFYSIGKNLRKK